MLELLALRHPASAKERKEGQIYILERTIGHMML